MLRGQALNDFIDTATGPELRAHVEHMRQVFDRLQDPTDPPVTIEVRRSEHGPQPTVVPSHLAGPVLRGLRLLLDFSTLDVRKATGIGRGTLDRIEHDRYRVEPPAGALTKRGARIKRAAPYCDARETLLAYYNSCLT